MSQSDIAWIFSHILNSKANIFYANIFMPILRQCFYANIEGFIFDSFLIMHVPNCVFFAVLLSETLEMVLFDGHRGLRFSKLQIKFKL